MSLEIDALVVRHARRAPPAIDRVTLHAQRGHTLAIVGPSGAGKSTLLRAIAGLLEIQGGGVRLDGQMLNRLAPQKRRIAMVFQDDALLHNLTVRANLRLALRRGGEHEKERVAQTARAMRVENHLNRRPHQLSGGERQRASIGRALLSNPSALLLDEPFVHLDPSLRRDVSAEVLGLREHFFGPILYVTHDHAEAMSVGERLAVLIEGRIEDIGDPARVYDRPRNLAVARFLGERPMNLFAEGSTIVGIRPENVEVGFDQSLRGRIVGREITGADAYLRVETQRGPILARVAATNERRCGELVGLHFTEAAVRRFDSSSGAAIA